MNTDSVPCGRNPQLFAPAMSIALRSVRYSLGGVPAKSEFLTESRVLFNSYRVQSDLYAAEANIRDFRGVEGGGGTRGEDRYQRRVQDPARVRALVVH